MTAPGDGILEWGVAARPIAGEERCGDHHLVLRTAGGWLLAVTDGLGHGPEAALASEAMAAVLQAHGELSLVELIRLGHAALRHTRGCAAALVTIDQADGALSWIGVGNVEGVIRHRDPAVSVANYITMRGGIVGYRLPVLQPSCLQLLAGDLLVLATDGIDSDFVRLALPPHPPQLLADHILACYAKPSDDALILVARWHLPTMPSAAARS